MSIRVTASKNPTEPDKTFYRIIGATAAEVHNQIYLLMLKVEDAGGCASFGMPQRHRYGPGFVAGGWTMEIVREEQPA